MNPTSQRPSRSASSCGSVPGWHELELDIRVLPFEARERRWHHRERGEETEMDSELAAQTGSRASRGKIGVCQFAQPGARLGSKFFARRRQGHATLGACEQRGAGASPTSSQAPGRRGVVATPAVPVRALQALQVLRAPRGLQAPRALARTQACRMQGPSCRRKSRQQKSRRLKMWSTSRTSMVSS
jgi:hypothetical protein